MFERYLKIPKIPKKNNFTLIRMVCCFVVIYEHSIYLSGIDFLILNIREFAVKVFFILSGFWVTISLLRSESIKEYAVKRCKKILPPYWTVVIVGALLLCAFTTLSAKEYFTDAGFWKYLFANIFSLNFLHPSLPGVFEGLPLNGAVNGALWTIKIELAFYVCLPFVLCFLNNYKNVRGGVLIAMYFLSFLYSVGCHWLVALKPSLAPLQNQFPAFVTYFSCGMAFALFWEPLLKILNYAVAPAFALLVLCLWLDNFILSALVLPLALSLVVFWFALRLPFGGRLVKNDFSFGMYLVHYPIVMLFVQQGFFASCWGLAFAGVIGLSFLCSYMLAK